ncbi:MAG: alanine--tRNA ligase [Firmicutes bacterium]|nr:alanine--tRNA ligase [Bacillota bacterium]
MQFLTVNQIRDKFLDFFVGKGHFLLPSFPLVPQGDKSSLFIMAGMAPMKPYFTGQEKPPSSRVTTCQKCIRTVDIDEVGKKARYGSFFEMLGNFSFGDYFKNEVIPWAWEFLINELQLPVEKLFISVYEEDDEAYAIWRDVVGIPEEKIFRFGKDENFWGLGIGPCGPCSEIHFDRGADRGCGKPDCVLGCDCDRYMEIWNLVFIQFEQLEDGSYIPLKNTGIDTGMGLERMAIVMQDVDSISDIDNIKGLCTKVLELAKISTPTKEQRVSVNIIADHVRSVVFLASDGVLPSNEGRGYVLRRLLRRAVRHGKSLGLEQFVNQIAQASIDTYGHGYPSLVEKSSHILQVLGNEESQFLKTLDTGMTLLQKHVDALKSAGQSSLSGSEAFKLYDTFGFPPDLTRELLEDAGLTWDEEGFQAEMQAQKERARAARGTSTYMGADETVYNMLPPNLPTEFCGYDHTACTTKIIALIADNEVAQEAKAGQEVSIVLSSTPFYATGGGQKGDSGKLTLDGALIEISDCITVTGNNTVHLGKVMEGTVKIGDTVSVTIDENRRRNIMCNHSATHLLQKALREVVGDHVEQAGSEVSADRLRFDFTHFSALSAEEKDKIETLVNEQIWANHPVEIVITTPDDARQQGATALFGEKYGDTVRMVKMGGFSVELCGGTHVANTQQIGMFKLLSENGIASGVRRIEAITGYTALQYFRETAATLLDVADICKAKPGELTGKIENLLAENKELKKELAKAQAAESGKEQGQVVENLLKNAEAVNGFTIVTAKLENYDIEALRTLCDKLKAEMKSGCLLLCGVNTDGAAQFLASATDDAVKAGIHAGNIVKEAAALCGGGGGGRPNHAQAGGKDASKADEALAGALAKMKEVLG